MAATSDRPAPLIDVPPPPDAGATLLGVHGLRSDFAAWLIRRGRGELLAETPSEWTRGSPPPRCEGIRSGGRCGRPMVERRDGAAVVWKCFDPGHPEPLTVREERPRPKLDREPRSGSLADLIAATRAGSTLDLVWDGEWRLKVVRNKTVASVVSGARGCSGKTNRRRGGAAEGRACAQKAVVWRDGRGWCYYHDPRAPKKFGEPREGFRR